MTNSEYFEENNVPFAKVMEIFNGQKNKKGGTESFDEFLAAPHSGFKFKAGDLVVLQLTSAAKKKGWTKNVVFKVVSQRDIADSGVYYAIAMTPDTYTEIGRNLRFDRCFFEDSCILY